VFFTWDGKKAYKGKIFTTKATKGHEGFFIRFSFEERMGMVDGGPWTVDRGWAV